MRAKGICLASKLKQSGCGRHLAFFPDDRDGLRLDRSSGRRRRARAILRQSVTRFPDWIDAKIELGIALYRLDKRKARKLWRGTRY